MNWTSQSPLKPTAAGRASIIEMGLMDNDVYATDYGGHPALKVAQEMNCAMTGTSGEHYGRRGSVTYL